MLATNGPRALVAETAVRAGITPNFLRVLAERGAVPAARVGKYWSFALSDIQLIRQAATAAGRPPLVAASEAPAT